MSQGASHDPLAVAQVFVARAPMWMVLLDLSGRFLAASPSLTKVMSARAMEAGLAGERSAKATPEITAPIAEVYEALARGEPVVEREHALPGQGGRPIHVRAQTSYWRDDDGRPVAVLSVIQDVTAEAQARAGLAESEAQLRAVVENMPAQISLVDLESGRIALMNVSLIRSLATYSGSSEGASIHEVLTPESKADHSAMIAKAEAAGGSAQIEATMPDGPAAGRTFRMKYVIFRDGRDRRQLLWTGEDITELREATEALQLAAAEAEAANLAKSEFLANMSHEIRTPLNGVMGVAGALARTPLTPAQQEMVSLIETSAQTLEVLLSDILDVARIEAGKVELGHEPFDLAASVNASSALFDAAAQAKGLDLLVEIAPEALGAYVGDAPRIRQILANLLGNAVKFTQLGHVELRVSAGRGETTSKLKFEVRDTGIGFDAETKVRLFSRFEQADGSITRRFGGSGLGLAISRSLAEAMGGQLEAYAEPGEGATFTLVLELPRCQGGLDLSLQTPELEPTADPLVGLRVLLAEDHPINRRVVEMILGASGVELTCVENGVEAVEAFRCSAFDLILMDMQMPQMDGLTAIAEIRRIEAATGAAATPIFLLTGNAMPEHISASIAAGADGHLSKPIRADTLLERVAETAADLQPNRFRQQTVGLCPASCPAVSCR